MCAYNKKNNIKVQKLNISIADKFKTTYKDKKLHGFGSSMTLAIRGITKNQIYTLTDRGPNMNGPQIILNKDDKEKKQSKVFISPQFNPHVVVFNLNENCLEAVKKIELKSREGMKMTGIPQNPNEYRNVREVPIDEKYNILEYDENGIDPEGITVDNQGDIWICEEYGPSIIQFSKEGIEKRRYTPSDGLPEIFKECYMNRGFEAITASENGKIYAVTQSVLDIKGKTHSTARIIRIIELDPQNQEIRQFAYNIPDNIYESSVDCKIGDIFSVGNHKFLVIEQGKCSKKTDGNGVRNVVNLIDLKDAEDISNIKIEGKPIEFSKNIEGLKCVNKKEIINLRENGWPFYKAEGIIAVDSRNILVINDNDFGIDLKVREVQNDGEADEVDILNYTLSEGKIFKGDSEELVKLESQPIKTHEELEVWKITFNEPII